MSNVSMEPVGKICWAADIPNSIREVRLKGDAIFAPIGTALYTATQMIEYRNQALEDAAKVCDSLIHYGEVSGVLCAKQIRALKELK